MRRRKLALHDLTEVDSVRAAALIAAASAADAWWLGVSAATTTPNAIAYLLSVDDLDAGVVAVRRAGDLAVVRVFVAPDQRRTGAARSAVGRILGERRWPDVTAYLAPVLHPTEATDALLRVTGFARIWSDRAGEVWVRSAPGALRQGRSATFPGCGGPHRPVSGARERKRGAASLGSHRRVDTWRSAHGEAGRRGAPPYAPGGDVAVLRRYLVDAGLLERTASGSEYRASTSGPGHGS